MTKSALIITAATIGSGVFALPYVVREAGWLLTLIYFAALGAVVVTVHAIYLKILAGENEKDRLLGLARKYFGTPGFWFGFIGIVVGLLVSFVIFLILGTQFVQLLIPSLPRTAALFIFWLLLAMPALASNRRATALAVTSVLCVTGVIVFIFASSFTVSPSLMMQNSPAINWSNLFLPFGIVLFSLAGWTGIEPLYESRETSNPERSAWPVIILGSTFAIALYAMFTAGILRSAPQITADTISGLAGWPLWERGVIAALGLFAIATVSIPISHEIRNGLEKDLRWNKIFSRLIIVGIPLLVVLLGFHDFALAIGLAGGIFISMQYLLIIAIGRRTLDLSPLKKFGLDLIALIFLAAIVFEIMRVVVQ
jgi:tyrosine-specific transport protein